MKKDKILVVLFLVVIFGVFISLPIKLVLVELGLLETSNDNWVTYQEITENNALDKLENIIGKVKNGVENRVTNYFPFYSNFNKMYQDFNYNSNKLVYNDIPLKTNSDGEYIFLDKNNGFYYLTTKYKKPELDKRMKKQIKFFNELDNEGIDINIYIPTRYELTKLKKNNLNSYIDTFKNNLNKDIKVSVMNIDSISKYKEYFYLTDHHWTIKGALDGYYSIAKMLNVPVIENLEVFNNEERKYYGSMAKMILNDSIHDYISDVKIDLNYKVLVNGKSSDNIFKPRKIRLDRDYKFYDYYVQYFNGQYGNVIYDYNQKDKDNLLILSDSYAWQIDYLIASHFNKTHVINLRYDEYQNNTFDIKSYMKENNIDKVLFLYEGGSILFDQYDYDFEGRVK